MLGDEGGFRFPTCCYRLNLIQVYENTMRVGLGSQGMYREFMGVKEDLDSNTLSQVQPVVNAMEIGDPRGMNREFQRVKEALDPDTLRG